MATTVLVMEDDKFMRELLRLHLVNAGYEVLEAEDAVVAGHLLLKEHPDILLADIEMPFMDGLEFVRALRADPAVSATPVIFISSRTDYEDRCKALGAIAFLRKPVLADELLSTVAKHAENGRVPL
jgi:two-component system, chemotaxis family, chemotaxis protein CheY